MSSENPHFVHLHVHSAYSLAEGAIRVKDLVKTCAKRRMPAVAITDTNNLFGAMEFATVAAKEGIQPVLGTQVTLDGGTQIVLLVQSEAGYKNLSKLISQAFLETEGHEDPHLTWAQLEAAPQGLICLSGGLAGPLGQALLHGQADEAARRAKAFKSLFGDRFYIEIQRHGLPEEEKIEDALVGLAYDLDIPLVATNDCYFTDRAMHEAHDALLCIAEGRYISEADRRRVTPEHYFKSAQEMTDLFADLPEAILNTGVIARRCSYLLKPIAPILPPFKTEGGRSEIEELKEQSRKGLEWRLKHFVPGSGTEEIDKPYFDRLEYELDIIVQMGFPGYFLIVSDFIKWSKARNIPVGPGRGSGAGSVVAWSLQITELDPLRFALLFERFLNPERVSMPDFDVDFCQERRDEVIKYVQDKYGHDSVAQIITFGKLQARAVVRDVGRVLQMPYGQVDRIAKMIPNNPANPITLEDALEQDADLRAERGKDETTDKLITIALQLEGLYRHASTHAAGVVIGDRPLHELVPLYRDPRSDMPVTQFNMKFVEQTGLVKFDFLGLKTMTVIQKAVDLIKKKGEEIDILQVPFDDPETYEMIRRGETLGVFQVESAGMRDLARQIEVSNFEELLAVIALYRPGPMENIPVYLKNVNNPDEIDYMHPKLKPITEDTHGVMIYQEQVMQAAQVLAGYTLGGADLLRRAMGKKIKEEMDKQRRIFIEGAKKHNDIPQEQADRIFDQIAAFAGYGFNKAHTAGYGLISLWTGWLKKHYPVEFMAASMTLDLGNTDKLGIFKQELDRMKIPLLLPDVNHSNVVFSVEGEKIRYALAALKGVGEQAMAHLVTERAGKGPFKTLEDFVGRMDVKHMNRRQFEQLVCAGAFDGLIDNRARLHAAADMIMRYASANAQEKASGQENLFGGGGDSDETGFGMPELPKDVYEWDPLEKLRHEFEAVGFYLSAHPLDSRRGQLEKMGVVEQAAVPDKLADTSAARIRMAGILIKKQEKVSAKSGNKFGILQVSDASGVYEVFLFSDILARCRSILEPGTAIMLHTDAEQREEQIRYTVQNVELLDPVLEERLSEVRVHLAGVAPVGQLRDLLEREGEGPARIVVVTDLSPARRAELRLPGRWKFGPAARNALRRSEGVLDISEF